MKILSVILISLSAFHIILFSTLTFTEARPSPLIFESWSNNNWLNINYKRDHPNEVGKLLHPPSLPSPPSPHLNPPSEPALSSPHPPTLLENSLTELSISLIFESWSNINDWLNINYKRDNPNEVGKLLGPLTPSPPSPQVDPPCKPGGLSSPSAPPCGHGLSSPHPPTLLKNSFTELSTPLIFDPASSVGKKTPTHSPPSPKPDDSHHPLVMMKHSPNQNVISYKFLPKDNYFFPNNHNAASA